MSGRTRMRSADTLLYLRVIKLIQSLFRGFGVYPGETRCSLSFSPVFRLAPTYLLLALLESDFNPIADVSAGRLDRRARRSVRSRARRLLHGPSSVSQHLMSFVPRLIRGVRRRFRYFLKYKFPECAMSK